jgi:hypothetical protein
MLAAIHTLLIIFMLLPAAVLAQQTQEDTISTYGLKEFVFFQDMRRYELLKRKTVKMYPYVMHAVKTLHDLDSTLATMTDKSAKKKLVKQVNEQLNADFRYVVINMTELEGQILTKLIHRYTGLTAYDIISEYQSGGKAVLWQGISLLGGANLKEEYHVEQEEMLEHIVGRIERGELKVSAEPLLLTKTQYKELKQGRKESNKRMKKALKKEVEASKPVVSNTK